jgi:hypothetical protein
MTSITPTERLLQTAMSRSSRLSEAMQRIGPQDLERAVGIQLRQQVEIATMKQAVQLHRSVERKILNEQR